MKTKRLLTALLFVGGVISASASDYYVSPAGSGDKTGADAANAWDVETLMDKFSSDNTATFENGDNIYFAGGKYVATKTLYVKMGLNLIGAAEGERTLFSGDANGDGEVNEGDRDRVFQINTAVGVGTTEKCVSISNIDFDGLFIAQGGNDTKGALYLDNCGALVTVSNCHFTRLINSGQGANALFSKRSSVKFVDCTFTDNKAANRGIVARLQGDTKKGYTTFERCLFANNEATGAEGDPCGMVMMQHGQEMTFNNCVFRDNHCNGNGAAIWNATAPDGTYPRRLILNNTLIYNNTSADGNAITLHANSNKEYNNSCIEYANDPRITISSVGYGTYYLGCSYVMPDGVTGQTISTAADGRLSIGTTYNPGDEVPTGTALLVSGAAGQYEPALATVTGEAPANLLKGSDVAETTTGGDKYYKLANDPVDGLGFYWAEDGGAAFTNGAHKAYLTLTGAQARFFSLDFDSETTGISTATTKAIRQGKFVENGFIVIVRNGIKYNAQGIKL